MKRLRIARCVQKIHSAWLTDAGAVELADDPLLLLRGRALRGREDEVPGPPERDRLLVKAERGHHLEMAHSLWLSYPDPLLQRKLKLQKARSPILRISLSSQGTNAFNMLIRFSFVYLCKIMFRPCEPTAALQK